MQEEIVCGGCGRRLEPPPDLPEGARLLCSHCLFMQRLPIAALEGAEKTRPAVWSIRVAWIGLLLMLAAGMTPSILYGFFTSRIAIGFIMAFALMIVVSIPAYLAIFRKMRNIQLNQAILYSLLGPWLLIWSFLPGVDQGQGRTLLWFGAAATLLGLGFLFVTLYSIRTLPRA